MDRLLLVTRPSYDDGTAYLHHYSSLILKMAKNKNILFKDFPGKQANRIEVSKFISKKNPKLMFINGHGSDKELEGDRGEVLISAKDDLSLVKDKIIYARACHAGNLLGKKIIEKGNGCFIGYNTPFSFWMSDSRSSTPLKDKAAALALKPSNEVMISLLNGKTTKEAFEISQKKVVESMQEVLKLNQKKEPGAMGLLQVLWTNYQGKVLHGREDLTF